MRDVSTVCSVGVPRERGVYLHVMEDGTTKMEELAMARVHDVERSPAVIPYIFASDNFGGRLAFGREMVRRSVLVY